MNNFILHLCVTFIITLIVISKIEDIWLTVEIVMIACWEKN
jgi:hypothetical protein